MTDAELEDLPEWAERAIEAGIPLMRLWTGEFVVGWLRPHKVVKPGPREMTVDEFLDRIEPAIKELDAEKEAPTREPSRREDQFLRRITARPPSATSWPLT